MKRCVIAAATAALALTIGAERISAHGGNYNGPGGSVSPTASPQGSPTTPPNPSPSPTPTGAPTPGSPTPGFGPTSPSPVAPGSGAAGSGARPVGAAGPAVTRRNRSGARTSFTDWDFWWGFNKDRFLNLKESLYRGRVESESAGFFIGRRTRLGASDTSRPTQAFVRGQLLPRLIKALDADSADVRDSACVAIGKVGSAGEVPVLLRMVKDKTRSVREGAVIGLGLLESPQAIAGLSAILRAGREGIKLRGGREPEQRLRAFAATSLGLIGVGGDADVRALLIDMSDDDTLNRNISVNCTIALGLLKGDAGSLAPVQKHLLGMAQKTSRDSWLRSHALIALARLHARNGLQSDAVMQKALRRIVRRDRTAHVRRSGIIGLGIVHRDNPDAETLKTLRSAFERGRDNASRHFAAIALGEIGGAIGFKALREATLTQRNQRGAYTALGLAILCDRLRGNPSAGEMRLEGLRALRAAFRRCKNPQLKGGYAVALGIARDREAGALLLNEMKRSRSTTLRGYLAIAMGMTNHQGARDYLTDVLAQSTNLPLLKQQVAIGLGLMGSRETVSALVGSLSSARSTYAMGSITKALGFIGDRNAIKPLAALVGNDGAQALTRGFACVALGSIADPRALPSLSALATHHNYLANTEALNELLDIL